MNEKRIEKMERLLNLASKKTEEFEKSLYEYKSIQKEINELNNYYGSKNWYKDREWLDNSNKNIKAGVLSEDLVYNLLQDNYSLAILMMEIALNIIKR